MQDPITTFDFISILASIASLILAVVAISLSIVFYRMATVASNATTDAAKGLVSSVERLENLFDKLYSDTFSMMRDTVSDMRKQLWPSDEVEPNKAIEETEKKADEKVDELKKNMEQQLSNMLQRQRVADHQVASLQSEIRQLIDRAIISSRQVETEAREETIREHILRELRSSRRQKPVVVVDDIMTKLINVFPPPRIFNELQRMKHEGIIEFSPGGRLRQATEVRISTSVEPANDKSS